MNKVNDKMDKIEQGQQGLEDRMRAQIEQGQQDMKEGQLRLEQQFVQGQAEAKAQVAMVGKEFNDRIDGLGQQFTVALAKIGDLEQGLAEANAHTSRVEEKIDGMVSSSQRP